MKFIAAILLLFSAAPVLAGGCNRPQDFEGNEELVMFHDFEDYRAIFPTIVGAVGRQGLTVLLIGPADCNAADIESRRAKVEADTRQKVILRLLIKDDTVISRARRSPETWAAVKEILPSLQNRRDKIGEDAEVLFVTDKADFYATDLPERRRKLEAILGKRVYVRLLRSF